MMAAIRTMPTIPTPSRMVVLRARGDDRVEGLRGEVERAGLERRQAVARRVIRVEGRGAAEGEPERAPHRIEDEPTERLGLRRRDDGEPVRGHARGREGAVVAPEARDATHDVVALVAPPAEPLERPPERPRDPRLLARGPHSKAVADAAQLEREHARDARHADLPHLLPRPEVVELLARGEEEPHAEPGRRRAALAEAEQDADGRGAVVGA